MCQNAASLRKQYFIDKNLCLYQSVDYKKIYIFRYMCKRLSRFQEVIIHSILFHFLNPQILFVFFYQECSLCDYKNYSLNNGMNPMLHYPKMTILIFCNYLYKIKSNLYTFCVTWPSFYIKGNFDRSVPWIQTLTIIIFFNILINL